MRSKRLFKCNYYQHKKHKYVSRESIGGYDLVKGSGAHRKTRTYRYKYTYAPATKTRNETLALEKNVAKYKKIKSELEDLKTKRFIAGLSYATQAMREKEEKLKKLYKDLPRKEQVKITYDEAVMTMIRNRVSHSARNLEQYENDVLALAVELGYYHPGSRFWFKGPNQRLLKRLKINRDT